MQKWKNGVHERKKKKKKNLLVLKTKVHSSKFCELPRNHVSGRGSSKRFLFSHFFVQIFIFFTFDVFFLEFGEAKMLHIYSKLNLEFFLSSHRFPICLFFSRICFFFLLYIICFWCEFHVFPCFSPKQQTHRHTQTARQTDRHTHTHTHNFWNK